MKKEWKDKWVTALRSGEYKQGIGGLKYDGKFCCLGVLSDLVIKMDDISNTTKDIWKTYDADLMNYSFPSAQTFTYVGVQPNKDISIADIIPGHARDIVLDHPYPFYYCLVQLNDGQRYTFEQIADVIEEKLETID